MNAINPAFSSSLPNDVKECVRANRHLARMSAERREFLEAEWKAAEHHPLPITDELRERARLEWENGNG